MSASKVDLTVQTTYSTYAITNLDVAVLGQQMVARAGGEQFFLLATAEGITRVQLHWDRIVSMTIRMLP